MSGCSGHFAGRNGFVTFAVMPDLIRHPAAARLRGEKGFSAQGLGLAGYRLEAGMTEEWEEIFSRPVYISHPTRASGSCEP
ncbi:hypothetical protein AGR4B_Cc70014 [Agrobacterium tumefaciens str. CFBP 5621]|nr:hypothetical protein AGR4B_Cc70014 [Agrobacterium tumefaciens str. CFBP 5621]